MAVQARQERAADAQFAAANAASDFPSGRTTYRRLFDYSEDMKRARAGATRTWCARSP